MSNEQAIQHLQRAIQCKTVSYKERDKIDFAEFERFIENLQADYPLVFSRAEFSRIAGHALLFKLKGQSDDLAPVGMMGHYDVVPVRPDGWKHDPFGGVIEGDYLYGRGTLDMKGHVIALLEALESLLAESATFERDLYLMFGHNEETGSNVPDSGAVAIRDHLKAQGIRFRMVCDEGGALIDGKPLGVDGVVALIGVGEKGYVDIELNALQPGGHAAMPPEVSAMQAVFEAAVKLERDKFPSDFTPATESMFDALVPHMRQPLKFLFSYRNLFKPILIATMLKSPKTAATIRTTCVITQAQGSAAPNVLAQKGVVVLNSRIITGESVNSVRERVQRIVGADIQVTMHNGTEPTDISPSDGPEYAIIEKAIRQHYPHFKAVAPFLMIAGTDSRVYHGLAEGVYRLSPFEISEEDLQTMHADNERIKVTNFFKGIEFFKTLLVNATMK